MKWDFSKLKAQIKQEFSSIERFADALQITVDDLNSKLETGFTQREIYQMVQLLNINPANITEVFFVQDKCA